MIPPSYSSVMEHLANSLCDGDGVCIVLNPPILQQMMSCNISP